MDNRNELLQSIKDLWDECPTLEFGKLLAVLTFGKYGTHNPLFNSTTLKEIHLDVKKLRSDSNDIRKENKI